jgi:hypothetical protein
VTSSVSQIYFKSLYRSSDLLYRFSSLHPTDSAATLSYNRKRLQLVELDADRGRSVKEGLSF